MGSGPQVYAMTNYYGDELGAHAERVRRARAVARTPGLQPDDIDVVQFYDAFTPQVPLFFQEFGFCGEGEGAAYLASDEAPALQHQRAAGCPRPTCTGSTCSSRACARCGACRARRSTTSSHCLVTSGNVVPTGAIVLSKEPW